MENMITTEKIEIKPKGSYFEIDDNGFVINPASIEKIQSEWKPAVDDVIELYKQSYGESLKNVYIRGSVAKGEAVKYVSDLDTFSYVDLPKEEIKNGKIREIKDQFEKKYSFIDGLEICAYPLPKITNDTIILNQSVCVYGEPISVPKIKVGKDMALHAPSFKNRFDWFDKFLHKDEGIEKTKKDCVWIMKGLLRGGFELTMDRSLKYTRDLYLCYKIFSEYYPEKEAEMREVLDLALNPTSDKNKMKKIMENIGAFLLAEIPKYFDVKD